MYSIFFSKINCSFKLLEKRMREIIKIGDKVLIILWSFACETDARGVDKYFSGDKRNKYITPLLELGIKECDIKVLNCYRDSYDYMVKAINDSNILVLPGGNPEMLYNKILECNLLNTIREYKGTIIGESAGTELQLNTYFITAKNNYYKKFAWYKGFNVIDDTFYIDVHSVNNYRYLLKLQKVADEKMKNVYAIFDDGAMIYNRKTKELEIFGNVKCFTPEIK